MRHRLKDSFGESAQYRVVGEPISLPDAEALAKQDPYQFQWWALGLVGARPVEQKKGADKGIDGVITFHKDIKNGNGNGNGKWEYGKVIVQVKGGSVQRNQIATLKGDVEREKADAGIFITLEKPTKPMKSEAVDAGGFTTPLTGKVEFPKIQILTVEELLRDKKPELPQGLVKNYYKEAKPSQLGGGGLIRDGLGL